MVAEFDTARIEHRNRKKEQGEYWETQSSINSLFSSHFVIYLVIRDQKRSLSLSSFSEDFPIHHPHHEDHASVLVISKGRVQTSSEQNEWIPVHWRLRKHFRRPSGSQNIFNTCNIIAACKRSTQPKKADSHKTFTEKDNSVGDTFQIPDDAGSGASEKKAAKIKNRNLKRKEKRDGVC